MSTCGYLPGLERLAKLNSSSSGVECNLAVSLNASRDEVRDLLMPINKKWPISALMNALKRYPLKPRQRFTIVYVLVSGLNDSDRDLEELAALLGEIPVKVNLIPFNECRHLPYSPPGRAVLERWQDGLLRRNITATIRWSKGADIAAACGQLAGRRGGPA